MYKKTSYSMIEFLLSLGWAVALSASSGVSTEIRRGPHHPRGSPLPPGAPHPRHYRPSSTVDKLTQDSELLHDISHIEEDIGRPIEEMTDEELEFHYFKLHDFDKNTLLDGLEMLKAIYHTMDHDHSIEEKSDEEQTTSPEDDMLRYIELVDKVLEEDDLDRDGFISYPEFALGRSGGRTIDLTPKQSVPVELN